MSTFKFQHIGQVSFIPLFFLMIYKRNNYTQQKLDYFKMSTKEFLTENI